MAVLLVDGNHFFNRSLFTSVKYAKTSSKYLSTESEQVEFVKKVLTDIFSKVKILKPEGIIFTFDSKSWRKDLTKFNPDVSEIILNKLDFSYKSEREESTEIDYKSFYSLIDEVGKILSDKGILVLKKQGLEGDDLCYLTANKLLLDGKDCIIMTSDGDMRGLSRYTSTNYCVIINPTVKDKSIFVPINFINWLKERDSKEDIFDFNLTTNPLLTFNHNEIVEIEPLNFIFLKIFLGKSNESVPSIYSWKNSKNGNLNLTDRIVNLLYNKLIETIPTFKIEDLEDPIIRKNISIELYKIIHKPKDDIPLDIIDTMSDKILVNYYMKTLSDRTLPSNYVKEFSTINLSTSSMKNGVDYILENTRFSKPNTTSSDLFSLLDL